MTAQEPPLPPGAAGAATMPLPQSEQPLLHPSRSSVSSSPVQGGTGTEGLPAKPAIRRFARRTLGIILLLITVVLWTASNFLASFIFADNTYSKPYFVTYVNTAFFAISLIPTVFKRIHDNAYHGFSLQALWRARIKLFRKPEVEEDQVPLKPDDEEDGLEADGSPNGWSSSSGSHRRGPSADGAIEGKMSPWETAKLSLEFCMLWFVANYFTAACLKYTTVASSTILTSTSSVWTLLLGAFLRVESFTIRKLLGVLASLAGIVLISTVDLSDPNNDAHRGDFPHKSQKQIAIGDAMAFFSAIMYGLYTILMKKRIGNEDRVDMPLFFGLVGLFNVLVLWPGFFVLHWTGEETFELPPTNRIWAIVLINSTTSLFSDVCWAYAMLLTSPLIVTVGLSLTIPLSLIGQMVLQRQGESLAYWIGAVVVFVSFGFVTYESKEEKLEGARLERDGQRDDGEG